MTFIKNSVENQLFQKLAKWFQWKSQFGANCDKLSGAYWDETVFQLSQRKVSQIITVPSFWKNASSTFVKRFVGTVIDVNNENDFFPLKFVA